MLKAAVAIIDRANLGRLLPLMEAMRDETRIDLSIICGGSTVLERFAQPANDVEAAGYAVHRVWSEFEGDRPIAKARSLGQTCKDYAAKLQEIDPDVLVLIGDRYEALGVASAAATMRVPICHLQGGEVSGALDERYRHAITKLADYHVPATARARDNLIRMGERPESILAVGCPSADLAENIRPRHIYLGNEPVHSLLVCYHPDTTCGERAGEEMEAVLDAVRRTNIRAKILWPNMDAFSGDVAKRIRQQAQQRLAAQPAWETIKNLPPLEYQQCLADAACCVGNSSSFVRDAGFYGTPVALVGTRQDGRERAANVLDCCAGDCRQAIEHQLSNGRYPPSDLYGKPGISKRIVERLLTLEPYGQKRLAYAEQPQECAAWE